MGSRRSPSLLFLIPTSRMVSNLRVLVSTHLTLCSENSHRISNLLRYSMRPSPTSSTLATKSVPTSMTGDRGVRARSACSARSSSSVRSLRASLLPSLATISAITRVDEGSMKEFVRTVRQTDSTFAYVHSVEINPRQTMVHCHGYYHTASGLAVPTEVIDHARRKAGFGTFKQGKIRSNVKTRFFAYPGKTLAVPSLRRRSSSISTATGSPEARARHLWLLARWRQRSHDAESEAALDPSAPPCRCHHPTDQPRRDRESA